jgi:hypothetical protein
MSVTSSRVSLALSEDIFSLLMSTPSFVTGKQNDNLPQVPAKQGH